MNSINKMLEDDTENEKIEDKYIDENDVLTPYKIIA